MRIITLNIRNNSDRWKERFHLIINEFLKELPDVIALQEVFIPIHQANLIAESINQKIGPPYYSVFVQPKWDNDPNEGIAFLTKYPVLDIDSLNLTMGGRVAQKISISYENQIIHLVNTHLHHLPLHDETIRLKQINEILEWLIYKSKCDKNILLGDFNSKPESETQKTIRDTFCSAFASFHGHEPEYTFPTPLVQEQSEWFEPRTLDYIFFTKNCFKVINANLACHQPSLFDQFLYPSDHFGISAVLETI